MEKNMSLDLLYDLFVQGFLLVHVFPIWVSGKIFVKSFTPLDNCPGQAGDTAAEAALAEAQVAKALAERQTRLAEQVEWYNVDGSEIRRTTWDLV